MASPPSHWLAHPRGIEPASVATLPANADVVVIGGGVIGVSTSYWLARRGADVVLLEGKRLGWGATGRNAGLMLAAHNPLEDPASTRAVLREEAIEAEFVERGHLALAMTPSIWERMLDEVAQRPAGAPPLHLVDHDHCEELLGLHITARVLGGRWLPGAAAIHPVRFVQELAARAQRRGATIAYPVCARRVQRIHTRDALRVDTTRGAIRAPSVVVACSARTTRLVPSATRVLRGHRAPMCSTTPLAPVFQMGLAIDWGAYYWRQAADGAVVLGGGGTHEGLSRLLPTIFPKFPPFEIERRWEGIMDETPDGRPIVGRWPDAPDVWVAAGFGGHGLPPALGVGAALAEAIANGQTCPLLAPLDPARFHKEQAC